MQRGFGQEAEVAEHSTEFASRAALLAERIGQLFLADDLLLNQHLTQANSASPGHKVGAAQRLSGGLVSGALESGGSPLTCFHCASLSMTTGRNRITSSECTAVRCRLRTRSEEHTSELQSLAYLVCRLLLETKTVDCSAAGFRRDRKTTHLNAPHLLHKHAYF